MTVIERSFGRMELEGGSAYWLFEDGSIINWDAAVETVIIDSLTGVVSVYNTSLGVTTLVEQATP